MTLIQTVRGPVHLADLGETAMHEHIYADFRPRFREQSLAISRRELRELSALGGRTLVDVMPDPARDIGWYTDLAPQVDLHIILSTGFYVESAVPEALRALRGDDYVERFARELTQGIGDSPVRAGVIKVAAVKATLTPWEDRVYRAAARVQRATGVPICTHACMGARVQFDALVAGGADPERIYLSHIETVSGWEGRSMREQGVYLASIARDGGSLYFNNFTCEFYTPDEDIMYLLHYLHDRGLGHRVLFGIDANYTFDDTGRMWWEAEKEHPEAGIRDYAHTYRAVLPLMRRWGFADRDFQLMLAENPRRMFSTTRC